MPTRDPELESLIAGCDPELRQFVDALRAENLKLHRKVGTLRAATVSLENRVAILEEKLGTEAVLQSLTDAELEEKMTEIEDRVARRTRKEG